MVINREVVIAKLDEFISDIFQLPEIGWIERYPDFMKIWTCYARDGMD